MKLNLSYKEQRWNIGRRINMESGDMTDMIDGPMLVGIAALITSIVNAITTLRRHERLPERPRPPCMPRRRKGREIRSSRA